MKSGSLNLLEPSRPRRPDTLAFTVKISVQKVLNHSEVLKSGLTFWLRIFFQILAHPVFKL